MHNFMLYQQTLELTLLWLVYLFIHYIGISLIELIVGPWWRNAPM